MGNGTSREDNLRYHFYIKKRYLEAKTTNMNKRDFVVLHEIICITPSDLVPVDLDHVAVLFIINSSRSGKIHLRELIDFSKLVQEKIHCCGSQGLRNEIQALSTLLLWEYLQSHANHIDGFLTWIVRLLKESALIQLKEQEQIGNNSAPPPFLREDDVDYLSSSTITILYRILHVPETGDLSFGNFFDLLQQISENLGHMDISKEKYDDYVSVPAVKAFMKQFTEDWSKKMLDLSFVYDPKTSDSPRLGRF